MLAQSAEPVTGLLVRVGADYTFGKAHSPIRLATGEFVYVPIPERSERVAKGLGRPYAELTARVQKFVGTGDATGYIPADKWMHLDPDFEHLTYGNNANSKGDAIAGLKKGDFIAFYASLRAVDQPRTLVYALIGILTVQRLSPANEVPAQQRFLNAHTRRSPIASGDVVVFATPENSGRLDRALAIGEYRDRAYRVRRDLLDAWGGLSVRDGYIQRSAVPPKFSNAGRFRHWLLNAGATLVHTN